MKLLIAILEKVESPVVVIIYIWYYPSSIEHVEFCVNQRGPSRKAKYS